MNPTATPTPSAGFPPVRASTSPQTFVPGRAAREEILHRAYALWEREGHPTDRKLAHWLQAEAEVLPRS
jgi:hypothetical protein